MYHFIVFVLLLFFFPSLSEAADCPDAAVVVVASVFATLAVVFIVLGIIAFLIWKRRRGKGFFLYQEIISNAQCFLTATSFWLNARKLLSIRRSSISTLIGRRVDVVTSLFHNVTFNSMDLSISPDVV